MRAVEAHIEVPSKPARLTGWGVVGRALLIWRRVLAALPAIVRHAWRDTWTNWRVSRELLALARQARSGRDLFDRGDDITASVQRDSGFMLLMAGQAVKGFEALGRGALYVLFKGERPGLFTCCYHPIETLRAVGVSDVILAAVENYGPASEAVVCLMGPAGMRITKIGVERNGRGGAGRIERWATDGPGPNGPF